VQRHGIDRQLHPSQSGSTPHDRVTSPQIRSSHSLPLDRPRQRPLRFPAVVSNRPPIHRDRYDPPLIQQPFHRPPACWSASTPFTHLIRGTQIPIANAAPSTYPIPRFPPLEVCVRRPRCAPRCHDGPASATLHKLGSGGVLELGPLYPREQTSSARPATSEKCQRTKPLAR
jgi:hypothetical protein